MLPSRNESYYCSHRETVLFRDKQAAWLAWLEVVRFFFNKFRFRNICAPPHPCSSMDRDGRSPSGRTLPGSAQSESPAPLACFVPRIVSAALHGWQFLSKSVWVEALYTFLAGWSSGSDGFCFCGVQTWLKHLWLAAKWWTKASQPTSELLLLSAFFHFCPLQVQCPSSP